MDWLFNPEIWAALATLTALEIVLGVDNIIFLAIVAGRLPPEQQPRARTLGLAGAAGTRILLLFSLVWLTKLTRPLFEVFGQSFAVRDLVLIGGGLFLMAKSVLEIHDDLEKEESAPSASGAVFAGFAAVVAQIAVLDIVFSLDSVITAIGMTRNLPVMAAAIIIAVIFMMFFSGPASRFVERHPTMRILALSFLILIGMALVGEGFGLEIPKGYLYFAMAFSVVVEMINLRLRKRHG